MAKAIFISADCWLCVFDLLPAYQLGFGIALFSHRFNFYIDEHFKTRKRTLAFIEIRSKIGENGTNQMEIVNNNRKTLPTPQIQMPRKVSDSNFPHSFSVSSTKMLIDATPDPSDQQQK
ncbi:hypothetical protein niasHT_031358 [Heterodera trifolii]|uniref:Uncharacterized protein n=1 Tax=Heterodera trifolii TaxID=157864 RepID=A0ABD2IU44_9BILA